MKIALVHPDLGIGGAERLMVDAAMGLQSISGHSVTIYTSHHSPQHCFPETLRDLKVIVRGQLRNPLKTKLLLPFALVRNWWLAVTVVIEQLLLTAPQERIDCFVVDQLSASIPLLRLVAPVLFYGHYPDLLLSRRPGWLKRLYRLPFDWLEEWTTQQADLIVANSEFTARVFSQTFPKLPVPIRVLYPAIKLDAYARPVDMNDSQLSPLLKKKNVQLAIYALAELRSHLPPIQFNHLQLIIAGGYDERVSENVSYHRGLQRLADSLGFSHSTYFSNGTSDNNNNNTNNIINNNGSESSSHLSIMRTQILFLPSFSDNQRSYLLSKALVLLYTPSNEHFGIVPIEAMYSKVPVIAVGSGGPLETIRHGWNGWLCDDLTTDKTLSNEDCMRRMGHQFSKWISVLVKDGVAADSGSLRREMGERGRQWVAEKFELSAFNSQLDAMLQHLVADNNRHWLVWKYRLVMMLLFLCVVGILTRLL